MITPKADEVSDLERVDAIDAEVSFGTVLVRFSNGRNVRFDPERLWAYRHEPWNELIPLPDAEDAPPVWPPSS